MTTLADIHANCDEVGECLLWRGATNGAGAPYANISGKSTNLRKYVRELVHGPSQPGRMHIMKCDNPGCLVVSHIALLTKKEFGRKLAKTGVYSTPKRSAAIIAGRRASGKQLKLTMEKARQIRSDPRKAADVAAELGVSIGTVHQVRQGVAWREGVTGASVFSL